MPGLIVFKIMLIDLVKNVNWTFLQLFKGRPEKIEFIS